MKSKKTSEIAAFLEDFQKRLSAVTKAVKKQATIERDATQFEATITELGEPNYKDEEKIKLLVVTERKLKSCHGALEKQKSVLGVELAPLAEMLTKGGTYAGDILSEVVNNRLATVSACLLPFSLNRASAEALANQTDACNGAARKVVFYHQIASRVRLYSGLRMGQTESCAEYAEAESTKVLAVAEKIERVLSEAVSKAPNLMQFIPFTPSAGIEVSDEAAATAAGATTEGDQIN